MKYQQGSILAKSIIEIQKRSQSHLNKGKGVQVQGISSVGLPGVGMLQQAVGMRLKGESPSVPHSKSTPAGHQFSKMASFFIFIRTQITKSTIYFMNSGCEES